MYLSGIAFAKLEYTGARILVLECQNGGGLQGRRGVIVNETQYKFWVVLRESEEEDEIVERVRMMDAHILATDSNNTRDVKPQQLQEKGTIETVNPSAEEDNQKNHTSADKVPEFTRKRKRPHKDTFKSHQPSKVAKTDASSGSSTTSAQLPFTLLNSSKRSRIVKVEKKGLVFEMEGLESLWERDHRQPQQETERTKAKVQISSRNTATLTTSTCEPSGVAQTTVDTFTEETTVKTLSPSKTAVGNPQQSAPSQADESSPVSIITTPASLTTTSQSPKPKFTRRVIIHGDKLILKPVDRSTKKYRS